MWKVGIAKTEITAYEEGQGMFGYGMWYQNITKAATPLFARTYVLQSNNKLLILICAELGMISIYMKHKVVEALQADLPNYNISDQNVLITAQHTHSGPAGITQYTMYNLFVPGFRKSVFYAIKNKIVDSVKAAFENLKPAKVSFGTNDFKENEFIGINRSVEAYNINPEVKKEVKKEQAFDKNMYLLKIEDEQGNLLGSFNWFGLHTTCLSSKNTEIHFDNKGYAAQILENYLLKETSKSESIHAFAQAKAGDVTPNYIYDKKARRTRGPHESDDKNAEHFGKLQAQKAFEILSEKTEYLLPEIDSVLMYVDFSNVVPNPKFTGGEENVFTTAAAHGAAFFVGTAEGPGTQNLFETFTITATGWLANNVEKLRANFFKAERKKAVARKYQAQNPKIMTFETGEGRLMGAKHPRKIIIPDFIDPSLAMTKNASRLGAMDLKPWVPHILPIQIMVLGNLAILGVAAELTTIAGFRLEQTVAPILAKRGINKIVTSTYANGYNGYITTPEEYMLQYYEGGHTVFGKWTLPAYQTKFEYLAEQLLKPEDKRDLNKQVQPLIFDESVVWDGKSKVNQQLAMV